MKERPILFSAPMVRALLAGTKTQTRRAVKPTPPDDVTLTKYCSDAGWVYAADYTKLSLDKTPRIRWECPYGQPGDRLRVKEAAWMWCERRPNGTTKTGRQKWHYVPMQEAPIHYAADLARRPEAGIVSPDTGNVWGWRLKVGRFLPRWASRMQLLVTDVRVQRLQEISEADSLAEGITGPHKVGYSAYRVPDDSKPRYSCAVAAYEAIWCQINGPDAWDANPWVWAVTFKRVTP